LFPAQYASNPIQSTGNTGTKGHSYPNSPKKKANKTVLLAAAAMIPFVIGIGIYKMVNQPPKVVKPITESGKTSLPVTVNKATSSPTNTSTISNSTEVDAENQTSTSDPRIYPGAKVNGPKTATPEALAKANSAKVAVSTNQSGKKTTTGSTGEKSSTEAGYSPTCPDCKEFKREIKDEEEQTDKRIWQMKLEVHIKDKHPKK